MHDEYFIYIDEAGDEGFGKLKSESRGGQSQWLLLGAIIVAKENDRHLPKWRNEILERFPHQRRRDLHFNKLKHDQRVVACQNLSDKPFGACVVCSDKITIHDIRSAAYEKYKEKGHLYNYLVRLLLERVTNICAMKSRLTGNSCKVHITFSKRGGTDYGVMRDYLFLMRDGREKITPARSIKWDVLNPEDIRVEDHSKRAGLQLADVVTSATYSAFEPNTYGNTEDRYIRLLKQRYIRENRSIEHSGITLSPRQSARKPEVANILKVLE